MKKIDMLDDVSKLTGISYNALFDLCKTVNMCIAQAVKETVSDNEEYTYIDIGIGTITIRVDEDEIKYRFAPSRPLDTTIKDSLESQDGVLIDAINTKLKERFEKAYKELL